MLYMKELEGCDKRSQILDDSKRWVNIFKVIRQDTFFEFKYELQWQTFG